MNINFIKWLVEKSDGFSMHNNRSSVLDSEGYSRTQEEVKTNTIIYPLLLQRAIEGVNRQARLEAMPYTTISSHTLLSVQSWDDNKPDKHYLFDDLTEDQAKEAALKYIYDQE